MSREPEQQEPPAETVLIVTFIATEALHPVEVAAACLAEIGEEE